MEELETKRSIKNLNKTMKSKTFHKNSQQKHFVGGAFIFQLASSFIDSLFKGGTHQCSTKIFTLVCCSVLFLPTIQPNPFPLEAAFQGKCPPDGNPCTQICFNIHNNMYECGCKNGYILSTDGYNCILQEVSNVTSSHQKHDEKKSRQGYKYRKINFEPWFR